MATLDDIDAARQQFMQQPQPAPVAPTDAQSGGASLDDIDAARQREMQRRNMTPPPAGGTETVAPQTTLRGIARNAAVATSEDVPANLLNLVTNPVANVVGLPALTAYAAGHDLLARNFPSLGMTELTPDDRKALFEDFSDQDGNALINYAAKKAGIPTQSDVTAATPTERLVRKGVGAVDTALLAPGFPAKVIAGGSAVAGDQAATLVPDPYKQAVEMGTNTAGNVAGARTLNAIQSPTPSLPESQIIQMGKNYGVDLPTPPGTLGQFSQDTPFSGAPAAAARAAGQWRTAVSRLIGENTDRITQGTIGAADARTGAVMDRIERNPVHLDNTYQTQAAQIESDALTEFGANSPQFQRVRNLLDNSIAAVQPDGTIPGGTYASLIHRGSPLDNAINGRNSDIGSYGTRIKDSLQDALQRSVSPDDAAAYQQSRQQYAITRMIEPLTLRAGRPTTAGEIDPDQYLVAARNNAPTNSPAMDLARIGQMLPRTGSGRTAIGEAISAREMSHVFGPNLLWAFPPALAANRLLASHLRNPTPVGGGGIAAMTNPLIMAPTGP